MFAMIADNLMLLFGIFVLHEKTRKSLSTLPNKTFVVWAIQKFGDNIKLKIALTN